MQQFRRRRRRDRHDAVGGFHEAASHPQGGGKNPFDAQIVKAEYCSHDIDDRVDRAHFVKMDLLHRHAVHFGLRRPQPLEHETGFVLHGIGKVRRADQFQDVRQAAMMMPARQVDIDMGCLDAAFVGRADLQFKSINVDPGDSVAQRRCRHAGVDQRAQKHVAAQPGKRVQISCLQILHLNRLMIAANRPAPKPLSIFTTPTPAAQLFSMASSADRP